jgi:hypothetical protein
MRCEKSFCQQPQKKHHLSHISVTFGPAQNTTASLDFGGIGQDSLAAKRGHILQSERSKKERKKNQKSKKKKKKSSVFSFKPSASKRSISAVCCNGASCGETRVNPATARRRARLSISNKQQEDKVGGSGRADD